MKLFITDKKLMETIDHATGPEKLELLAKQQGNDVSITQFYPHYVISQCGTREPFQTSIVLQAGEACMTHSTEVCGPSMGRAMDLE